MFRKILSAILLVVMSSAIFGFVLAKPSSMVDDDKLQSNTKNLTFTGSAFGLADPFQLQLQYSKQYGIYVVGQFAIPYSFRTASAVEINYGAKERRFNVTWGHSFNSAQRFKLSAEHFSQNMSFDFQSGIVQHWVGQNAVGATYEFLFHHKRIHDIQLNVYTSHADSDFLPDMTMKSGDINERHIAGADANGGSVQIDFTPSELNQLSVELNYDRVRYPTIYEDASRYNRTGLGETITFEQLLSQRAKLDLSLSRRKIYDNYGLALHRLIHSAPGTKFEIGVIGSRLINHDGIPNDSRVGFDMTYSWGGRVSRIGPEPSYSLENDMAQSDIVSWVQRPAVRMEQVLAVKDERTIKGKLPTLTIHPEPTPSWQIGQTISQKIADIDSADSPLISVDYSADAFKNYGLALEEQNRTAKHDEIWITGKVVQATTSTQSTPIVAKNLGGAAQGAFSLILVDGKKPIITIYPEPTSPWAVGTDLNKKIADIDSISPITSVSFVADVFKDYGLTLSERNKSDLHDEIWISGQVAKATASPQQTKISGSNVSGATDGGFSLTLVDASKPVVTIHNPTTPCKVGETIAPFTFANIDPKSGTIVKVTYNKDAFSDYGLAIAEDPNTHALSVSGTPAKETPSTGVALTITATNSFQKDSDPSTFTLQILPRAKITAVLKCPLPGMPFRIRSEGGVYIDVKDDHGNAYHFVYEGGGVKASDQVGSVDSANYEPQGTTKTFRCFVLLKGKTNFIAMDAVPVPSMPAENVKFKGDNPFQCLTGSLQSQQNCPLQYDY